MKAEMAISRLTVLFLYLFVTSDFQVCATEPVTISNLTSLYLFNEIINIDLNTIEFRKQDNFDYVFHNLIENKNSILMNFQDNNYLSNPYLWDGSHSDWNRVNNELIEIQPDNMNFKKADFQGILSNIAQDYAYQLNIRLLVQSYRELLLSGFSSITKDFLEGSQSEINEVATSYFGHFYHSLVDMVNINMDFGKFGIDPSFGFGSTGIRCSYKFLYGTISSSWNLDQNKISLRVRIPFNYSRIMNYSIVENLILQPKKVINREKVVNY